MAGIVLISLAGCGSTTSESSEPTASVASADDTTTSTGGVTTTTAPPPTPTTTTTTTTTTTFDPLANLPDAGTTPYPRTTHRIDLDALASDGDDALAMDRVIDHIGFYASSYVPVNSTFVRFRNTVGQGFSPGVFVSETLAVSIEYGGTASELADLVANQIAATIPAPVEWGTFPVFPTK